MTDDRAISTPIDVVLGLVLVGLATGVVATAAPAPVESPADGGQAALLGSSVTVEFEAGDDHWTVHESVGGHLADAARAGQEPITPEDEAYRVAAQAAITDHVETYGPHVQVVGFCRNVSTPDPFVAGRTPPADRPVSATVYELPEPTDGNETACRPTVVLRRWSP